MAATDFGSLTEAKARHWSASLWQAGRDESFWFSNGFVGKNDDDMDSVIQRVTKLTQTERGLEVVMQLVQDLVGDGIAGDNEMEGNEEALYNETQVIRVDMLRNAVRSKGEMAEQATVIRFRATAKKKLAFWQADRTDEMGFLVASGRAFTLTLGGATRGTSQLPQLTFAADVVAASTNRIVYAGAATSEGTLTASDKMTWDVIVRANTIAKRKRVRQIKSRGKGYYAMVMSSEQARDLKLDPTYQTILRSAEKRGAGNPLFDNALAVVDGVILYDHNRVYNTLDATSGVDMWGSGNTVNGAQALLFGAQAFGMATIGNQFMRESDNTDYGNRPALGTGRKLGFLKPQWKSIPDGQTVEDFGVISVKTAAAAT